MLGFHHAFRNSKNWGICDAILGRFFLASPIVAAACVYLVMPKGFLPERQMD